MEKTKTLEQINSEIALINEFLSLASKKPFDFLKLIQIDTTKKPHCCIDEINKALVSKMDTLSIERNNCIAASKAKGVTYAQSLGLKNINWVELLDSITPEDDWAYLESLASIDSPGTNPTSLFDSRWDRYTESDDINEIYAGMPIHDHISEEGAKFWTFIQMRNLKMVIHTFNEIIRMYNEGKRPEWIDFPVFEKND